jgi:hypothetical protein
VQKGATTRPANHSIPRNTPPTQRTQQRQLSHSKCWFEARERVRNAPVTAITGADVRDALTESMSNSLVLGTHVGCHVRASPFCTALTHVVKPHLVVGVEVAAIPLRHLRAGGPLISLVAEAKRSLRLPCACPFVHILCIEFNPMHMHMHMHCALYASHAVVVSRSWQRLLCLCRDAPGTQSGTAALESHHRCLARHGGGMPGGNMHRGMDHEPRRKAT